MRTRSKYGVRTDAAGKQRRTCDGILFASQRECRRYGELKLLEKAGEISGLECQPSFVLWAQRYPCQLVNMPVIVAKYIADFRYYRRDGELVIEDVKGVRTPLYRLKKRITEVQYGIAITEI
jgi:hypothetical protein